MPTTARRLTPTAALTLSALALVALTTVAIRARIASPIPTLAPATPLVELSRVRLSEAELRDKDIAFYAQRVADDAESATDRLTLAGLLFARARSTGSTGDLARVEQLARASIARRTQRNGQAFELLASVLMTRHEFRAAHVVAARIDSLDPGTPSHLALLGEIELELGDYDAAAAHFKAVHYGGDQFTVGARVARWYEVTGHADIARAMLQRSIRDADQRDDLPREQVAWFHYRLGELELRLGHLSAADSAFQRGLLRHPDDVRILGGLARTALARGDWRAAITNGEAATNVQLDPTTLGAVSLAYAARGDTAQAARYAAGMSVSALTQPGAIHRAWGQFLLDHGTPAQRAEVLRRAQRELQDRHDVYGHDLLAWALHRAGRAAEARAEMRLALAQQTEDVMLAAHAAAIEGAIGTR